MNSSAGMDAPITAPPSPEAVATVLPLVRSAIAQRLLALLAGGGLMLSLLLGLLPLGLPQTTRFWLVLGCALVTLSSLLTLRLRPQLARRAALWLALGLVALLWLQAAVSGAGLSAPGLALMSLLVCLACVAASARAGVGVALLAGLGAAVLAYAQYRRWLAPAAEELVLPGWQLAEHLLVLALGLGLGLLAQHMVMRQVALAQGRAQRAHALVALAADAVWELDAQLRLSALQRSDGLDGPRAPHSLVGRSPFDTQRMRFDADTRQLLQQRLEARKPFRELPLLWQGRDGVVQEWRVSGEPRRDSRGAFQGYRGIALLAPAAQPQLLPQAVPVAPPAPAVAVGALAGARVLVVEDNAMNMLFVVTLLLQWGMRVEQAIDGEQALRAVARAAASGRRFDLILMDVQMPRMNGHEAARRLRQFSEQHGAPIIALTAQSQDSDREAALSAGMSDFLTKPIDAQRLRSTLLRWLGAAPASA